MSTPALTPLQARARLRRALQHLAATPLGLLGLAVAHALGAAHVTTTSTWSQVGAGVLGAFLTWLLHNTARRKYAQAIVPVLVAVATAAIPVLTTGKLGALAGTAVVLPILHVLTGAWNAATTTGTGAAATGPEAGMESAVTDLAAPPVAREGGVPQTAVRTETTALPKLTPELLAQMDAAKAAAPAATLAPVVSEATSTTSTPDAPAEAAAPVSVPAGFAGNPVAPPVRRSGLRAANGGRP